MKAKLEPVNTLHLFPVLDEMLIDLLKSLSPDEWEFQTIAGLWQVKDVAAHLLDGNIRGLSMSRDNYFTGQSKNLETYFEMVSYLNKINAEWVTAFKRVSPAVLIDLLAVTGEAYYNHIKLLDPSKKALFPVAWAGEAESTNWMHIAREYTEKWLHQQQIRDAAGRPGLLTRDLFQPFISIIMLGLPHALRDVEAEESALIRVTIPTAMGGTWHICRGYNKWSFIDNPLKVPDAEVTIEPEVAWKLFSKSIRPWSITRGVQITGNHRFCKGVLNMVSVMA